MQHWYESEKGSGLATLAAGKRSRRAWLCHAPWICAGVLGATAWPRGQEKGGEEEGEVLPTEDLMREHGVLRRVLLVYEEAGRRLDASMDAAAAAIREGAEIIRTFIEDYHEKLEEDSIFPRFEKAGRLVELTKVLRAQHEAGRRVTEEIRRLSSAKGVGDASALRTRIQAFARMYRPHAAREDTVLFPAIRSVVRGRQFAELGDQFEKKERDLFGEGGFEKMVDRVASLEKTLGIYDLSAFTPRGGTAPAR